MTRFILATLIVAVLTAPGWAQEIKIETRPTVDKGVVTVTGKFKDVSNFKVQVTKATETKWADTGKINSFSFTTYTVVGETSPLKPGNYKVRFYTTSDVTGLPVYSNEVDVNVPGGVCCPPPCCPPPCCPPLTSEEHDGADSLSSRTPEGRTQETGSNEAASATTVIDRLRQHC